ncbi:Hypothetical protein NGAL_HAMBI2605_62680 [Neorhizobium galegae bv. orientalis]|nr:Hypothetical protein NGAL_HAMBI2605_62680 [Neorhizobium galegae bv. orientalis]
MDRKTNQAIIRKIMLTEWDPIGVSGIPEAQDEYDAYADTVFDMLATRGCLAAGGFWACASMRLRTAQPMAT